MERTAAVEGLAGQTRASSPRHLLTFAVEDYFQAGALHGLISPHHWLRFESRVEHSVRRVLDLLDGCDTRATFFVLGWVADQMPEIVRELLRRGHEVASKGYHHRSLSDMSPAEFREDAARSREAIERAGARQVLGYRIAHGSFGVTDLWALDVLAEEGFAYDSSFYPRLRSIGDDAWRRFPFRHSAGERSIREFPLSSLRMGGLSVPVGGGNYFRQAPHAAATALLRAWERRSAQPFVMHFHVWELDPDTPYVTAARRLARVRQHRNVDQMLARLEDLLRHFRFGSIAAHLGLDPQREVAHVPARSAPAAVVALAAARTPVTLVVPCYNETLGLPYLANTLQDLGRSLPEYSFRFVFVDDGSTDDTREQLQRLFGGRPDCQLVCQPRNSGVAAAILAGVAAAGTEIVCSIDCDCTYDPRQLEGMLPLLREGVDLVTASPYHPLGRVTQVPRWRLFLSRGLSRLYRIVLRSELATFTSCFRVYRRSAVSGLELRESGFLGVAEMLGVLHLRGARIVEHPAVLEVRMLGRSKMKVPRTILGHLRLLARFTRARIVRERPPAKQLPPPVAQRYS